MKLLSLFAASALLATTASLVASADQNEEQLFDNFITKFDKAYKADNVERAKRFKIFKKNLEIAAEQNKLNPHATFGVTPFSDLSAAEFKSYHNADKHYAELRNKKIPEMQKFQPSIKNLKDASLVVDWRKKGAVTAVKNQGQCGSCWSFSTTGCTEGAWFLAGHDLVSLSEEFFVECDNPAHGGKDDACNGGLPSNAIDWVVNSQWKGAIPTEASYPYNSGSGSVGQCQVSGWKVGARVQGERALEHNEAAMWGALSGDGPISIGVAASQGWQTYTGGIMTNCNSRQVDHGVLIVGVNLENAVPYWVIKNSWGPSWGEQGFLRVQYGTNQCDITFAPLLVVIDKNSVPTPAPLVPTPPPVPTTPVPPTTMTPPSPFPGKSWYLLYAPPGLTSLSMAMAISAVGPKDVYIGGLESGSGNGAGAKVMHGDGAANGIFYPLAHETGLPFMAMEMALGGNPMDYHGAVCGLEFPLIEKSPFAYFKNATTIAESTIINGGFMNIVQGCNADVTDGMYILGADQGSNAKNLQGLLSVDGGRTFVPVPVGNATIAQPGCTFPRYATVASKNVMYMSLGDWGSNNSQSFSAHEENIRNIKENKHEWKETATRTLYRDPKTGQTKRKFAGALDTYLSMNKNVEGSGSSSSGSSYCGNSAEILRTTDSGRTWKSVFSSVDKFYFNEITCASETNCVAVGEGFQDADAGVRVYTTFDGENWERTMFIPNTQEKAWSFFSVEVANKFEGEYWIGGSFQLPDRQSAAAMFHSLDGGKTWAEYKHNIPTLVEVAQISFPSGSAGDIGFAIAMDQFQASTIIRYDRHAVGPGPAPQQNFFTQKNCVTDKCDALCQQIEFPTYMCLQAQTGSVKAHISADAQNLEQVSYETTDCSGKGQTSTVALNKCMKGQNGQYFEFSVYNSNSTGVSKASNVHTPRRMADITKDKVSMKF